MQNSIKTKDWRTTSGNTLSRNDTHVRLGSTNSFIKIKSIGDWSIIGVPVDSYGNEIGVTQSMYNGSYTSIDLGKMVDNCPSGYDRTLCYTLI